jgi:hypothetical protein
MKLSKTNKFLIFGSVAALISYGVYVWLLSKKKLEAPLSKTATPLPPSAKFTGKIQTTTNNRPPNYPDETVGFGLKTWAEIIYPDGHTDWLEVVA